MKTFEFLSYLKSLDINVFAEDNQLRIDAPKGALTSTLQKKLIERKMEILSLLQATDTTLTTVQPTSREQDLPLSFAQERLWFLDQLEPDTPIYNITSAFRLTGPLNVSALEQSLNRVVQRHEALRTTSAIANGQPVQIIAALLTIPLPIRNLQLLPPSEREPKAQRLANQEAQRPFNLAQGPLFRATLIKLDNEQHILILAMHHIISDGWSMGILYQELSTLYSAFLNNQPDPLPELPIQYADFALWQRNWLQGDVLAQQLTHWKDQLADAPSVLELPTDRPRPPAQTFRGAEQAVILPTHLSNALHQLSNQQGVTLFMTLLTAFHTLLYRYSRQDTIVVGSPIANRNRPEIENLIGFFVNTLALRLDLSDDLTFTQALAQMRQVALQAYENQDLPFEKLVEELQPERNPSYSPLVQVLFTFQNTPVAPLRLANLSVEPFAVDTQITKFDLSLTLTEYDDQIRGGLTFNLDLFNPDTIRRMADHFRVLLEAVATNPDIPVSHLPLLTNAERHQILVEWNDTAAEYPGDKCIHHLFEEQVERTPDNIAVVFEDQQLTYRKLNVRANQLAHYLRKQGVGPDVLVGICVERSLEMIVGILGILKAGGAYVPLDVKYPEDRVVYLLTDAQPLILLTQHRLLNSLPIINLPAIALDTEWKIIAQESKQNPDSDVVENNLAYIIYTSGSTGQPKGVGIEHQSLNNYLWWVGTNLFESPQRIAIPNTTSLTFDASLKQIFGPLLRGDKVWLASNDSIANSQFLLENVEQHTNVYFNSVPSLWLDTLNEIQSQRKTLSDNLSALLLGGEQVNPNLIRQTLRLCPNLTIWNLYGPTETTANSTACKLRSDGILSIGRPIANTQVYLLDSNLQPVPIGVPGEIHIGGDGLARGYLNRPDLTKEKFIPNPFSDTSGDRLYKTGDLARYLPDGNIEFLGRIDHQVKIRGFRIELGEIEAVLRQHPDVDQCVVVAREDRPGDRRLVAYVTSAAPQSQPSTNDLRTFLKQKLPDYMVPSLFVSLDALPLTPNGKIDRKALPAPDPSRPQLDQAYAAPKTPVEEKLAEIWQDVLGLEQVGVRDNFFDLGGHSLLATQVMYRIREMLQVEIPLRLLFTSPTVAELAQHIEELVHWSNQQAIAQPGAEDSEAWDEFEL